MVVKPCSDELSVTKIAYAINLLVEKTFEMHQYFESEMYSRCIKCIEVLAEIICLVRKLKWLLTYLINTDGSFHQIRILIEDYETCRQLFYKIKKHIGKLKTQKKLLKNIRKF